MYLGKIKKKKIFQTIFINLIEILIKIITVNLILIVKIIIIVNVL